MPIPSKPSYTHGSTGSAPPSARDYTSGDPVDADELDYFVNTPLEKIKDLVDYLENVDPNEDGTVAEADSALTYKGNDIDGDGDGTVDQADDALKYKNNDIDSDGDGKVDSAESADDATNVTSTYKGNDIDSNGDGKVDSAEQADDSTLISGKRITVSSSQPVNRDDKDIWIDTS